MQKNDYFCIWERCCPVNFNNYKKCIYVNLYTLWQL